MLVMAGKGYRKNQFGPLGLLCLTLVSVNTLMAFVPVRPKTTPVESPAASIEIITHLARGEFTSVTNRFDEVLQKSLPPEKLKQAWFSLREQVGPYKKHITTQNRKRQQYNVVQMTCAFERSPVDIKVVYDPKGKITGLWFKSHQQIILPRQYRIPAYADPANFQEQQIKLETPSGSLPATITLPKQNGSFPGLVLIRGPQTYDLDSANTGNDPDRDIALGLACQGIVVLRYERAAPINSEETNTPLPQTNQKNTLIQDALAAIAYLRQMKQTDPKEIFIAGHYLSGFAIPWILQTDVNLAGAIFQATPTRRLEDAYLAQMNYLYFLDGKLATDERRQLQKMKRQIQLVRNPNLSVDHPGSDLPYGFPGGFWRELRESHPPAAVREMEIPLLILQGGRDYLTTLDDYRGWKKYLALRNNVDFKLYLRLNHFFMVGKGAGKSDPEEHKMPDHVSKQVIEDIANWIKRL
jgi:uncharacterized protein